VSCATDCVYTLCTLPCFCGVSMRALFVPLLVAQFQPYLHHPVLGCNVFVACTLCVLTPQPNGPQSLSLSVKGSFNTGSPLKVTGPDFHAEFSRGPQTLSVTCEVCVSLPPLPLPLPLPPARLPNRWCVGAASRR
jgi:hypothetical protein